MRVVQIASFYGPRSGGLRTTVDSLGRGYLLAGHERVLIVPGPSDADEDTDAGRRITVRSPVLPGAGGYRVLRDRARLERLIDDLRPDRLEVSDRVLAAFFGRVAARRRVPSLLLSHERLDGILACRVPKVVPRARLADAWNRRVLASDHTVVCASAWSAEEWRRIGGDPVQIPLGVDLDTFHPSAAERSIGPEVVTIACVGRLSREKNPELAIDTLSALVEGGMNARLVLVGAGPSERSLRARAAGLPVTFGGHLTHAAVASVLASADVALAPCPVETFGLAVLEAMACGTPVVIADGGGAPELLAPHAGRLAPPRRDDFATAVQAVLNEDRDVARAAARRAAERYPWRATVDGMLAAHGMSMAAR